MPTRRAHRQISSMLAARHTPRQTSSMLAARHTPRQTSSMLAARRTPPSTSPRGPRPACSAAQLSAALGLARSAIDNDSDVLPQQEHLHHLSTLLPPLSASLPTLHARLLSDDPDPEVPLFRRCRRLARPLFAHDVALPLFHLSADLLTCVALPSPPPVAALHLSLSAVCAPGRTATRRFALVLAPHVPARENAANLAIFVSSVRAFAAARELPPLPHIHLRLSVTLLPAPNAPAPLFHRLRHRVALRLADLSAGHLGFQADRVFGTLHVNNAPYTFPPAPDLRFQKYVDADLVSEDVAAQLAAQLLLRRSSSKLTDILQHTMDSRVTTVRILCLSQGSWAPLPLLCAALRHHSDHIRTYVNAHGLRTLEMRLDDFGEWDQAILDHALLKGMTAAVLLFRFQHLEGLGRAISRSKAITDKFTGLTTDVGRIMYIDTATKYGFTQARKCVQEVAVERRFFEPSAQKDVFFEATDAAWMEADISERVQSKTSLLHAELRGPSRPYLEKIVRIVNREVSTEEAREETQECIAFLLRLKSAINTKITVRKDPRCITIRRGDATGFGITGLQMRRMMREQDYRDFHDVTTTKPYTVDVRVFLGETATAAHEVGRFGKKWGVVTRLGGVADSESETFMAVANERRTVLESGRERFVTGVNVTVLGGELEEYLHARMIGACLAAVDADREQKTQTAAAALLRLVPTLYGLIQPSM